MPSSARRPVTSSRSSLALAALLAATLLFASSAPADDSPSFFSYFGFDEASYSAAGRDGLREIVSGRMFNAAIPLGIYTARDVKDSKRRDELGYDPLAPEGRFYRAGLLPPAPSVDSGVPLGFTKFDRKGAPVVTLNCFACHAGVVNGLVVAGLGSNSVIQPNTKDPCRGDNYGQYAVWTYAARLADPAKTGLRPSAEKTDLVKLIESTPLPPVQAMPWWLMKYKVRDYWYGDGGPTDAAHFSLNFTVAHAEVNENHAAHVASTAKALAFARETQSPAYPGALDPALVQLGADLFHGRQPPANAAGFKACYECHGSYAKKSSAPDLAKPGGWDVDYDGSEALRNVGTDPSYSEVVQKFRPIIDHIGKLKEYYDAQGTPELFPKGNPLEGKGYVPPPLVGVWATAPYFHNGSVPTIQAVLDSSSRPEIWARDQSPRAYDLAKVGMVHTSLSRSDYDAAKEKARASDPVSKAAVDLSFVYDTTAFARSNSGHKFGDALAADERAGVIEFLKSLSGPDM